MPTPIYHITHVDNLPLIIDSNGLKTVNVLKNSQTEYVDSALQTIQDQRANVIVPCASKGVLHDYVPFYFAPRSPMLCSIDHSKGRSYQNEIVHLVAEAESIKTSKLDFVFTDGHAIMAYSRFYDDLTDLSKIDWQIMKEKYWRDTDRDGDRKRRRQAEFLVHRFFPWTQIKGIGVVDDKIKAKVEAILQNYQDRPSVKKYPQWYY